MVDVKKFTKDATADFLSAQRREQIVRWPWGEAKGKDSMVDHT